MSDPERRVLDDIEELVNEELTYTPDDYTKNNERYDKCELCQQLWHGLPRGACPGAYATPEQRRRYLERPKGKGEYIGYVTTQYEGTLCAVHLYRDDDGGFVGLLQPLPDEHPRGLNSDLYSFDEARASFTMHTFEEGFEMPIMFVPQDNPRIARFPDTP